MSTANDRAGAQPRRLHACTLLLLLAIGASASAQSIHRVTSSTGVAFELPGHLRESAVQDASLAKKPGVERLFMDANGGLRVAVVHAPTDALRVEDLPQHSGPLPQAYADGFAAGLANAQQVGVSEVRAGHYDHEKPAFSMSARTLAPSIARVLLDQPDASPHWQEIKRANIDLKLARCLLAGLLANEPDALPRALRARAASTAQQCDVSEAYVHRYLDTTGPSLFASQAARLHAIGIPTRTALVLILTSAPDAMQQQAAAISNTIWARLAVSPEARTQHWMLGAPFQSGLLLGSVLGAVLFTLLLSTLLGRGLTRVGVSPTFAAAIAVATALAFGAAFVREHGRPHSG